ncbi:hypothetical protein BI364_13115 [Acidihalobacter yilgarnensis]|uniref:Lipoprotein n=1 Tax=Acidihalobacter yilgarnensis TaxID=2819280 RepID=A0A1D8IQN5_9GAMM|nr:hypothetical protein [Acidihalobacter yilgarnensis]AOU98779.1 hypothetical protein BI364_13115 [Acidihalobacter yilgarnensis]
MRKRFFQFLPLCTLLLLQGCSYSHLHFNSPTNGAAPTCIEHMRGACPLGSHAPNASPSN